MKYIIALTFFFMTILSSCSDDTTAPTDNTPKDTIPTISIGSQAWMAKNLDIAKFRNGEAIPEAKTASAWFTAAEAKKPVWCYNEFNSENGVKYGKLYNWYAVNDARGLAPEGFHVPTDVEWTRLINQLIGDMVAGSKLKSKTDWFNNGNGTNTSGFTALPAGYITESGLFFGLSELGCWWSSTEDGTADALSRDISHENSQVRRYNAPKTEGLSVRCVRD